MSSSKHHQQQQPVTLPDYLWEYLKRIWYRIRRAWHTYMTGQPIDERRKPERKSTWRRLLGRNPRSNPEYQGGMTNLNDLFRKHNPVLAQFYVQPKKGQPQTTVGRGPGEAFLSFSVALWVVGYFYPYMGLYISKIYGMTVLVACTYLVVSRRPKPPTDPKSSNKTPHQPISAELQLFLRIHVIYIFLSLIDRFYDLAQNISCLWPYWVVVISTFGNGNAKGGEEPFAMMPLTLAVRFIAMAGSAFVPAIKSDRTETINRPKQYAGFVTGFAEALPEVYEILECIAFDLRTPIIWIIAASVCGVGYLLANGMKHVYLAYIITCFFGLYGTLKLTEGINEKQRLNPKEIPINSRAYNVLCFWAIWHVAWAIKTLPYFKWAVEQIAPGYLLVELIIMIICLNFYPHPEHGFACFLFEVIVKLTSSLSG